MNNPEMVVRMNAIIGELEAQRNTMSVRATTLAAEVAMKNERIASLDGQNATLAARVKELEAQQVPQE